MRWPPKLGFWPKAGVSGYKKQRKPFFFDRLPRFKIFFLANISDNFRKLQMFFSVVRCHLLRQRSVMLVKKPTA
jgi:hypothetical protein